MILDMVIVHLITLSKMEANKSKKHKWRPRFACALTIVFSCQQHHWFGGLWTIAVIYELSCVTTHNVSLIQVLIKRFLYACFHGFT